MESFLLVAHIILSFVMVIVILLQSGQGGGMGTGFGGAAAAGQEIFGGRGAATFLGKLTVALGASFMITSMALAWFSSKPQSVLDLSSGSSGGGSAQVHQIIEEGRAGQSPEEGELMQEFQNQNGNVGGQEIPPEVLEQLQQQMDGDEGTMPPIELDVTPVPGDIDAAEVQEPASEPAAEEPASEPAAEEPASEPAAEEPASEPAASEPAAAEPASEPAAEEPASEPATEEPASEPAAEEPASEPATEEPAAEDSEEE